MSESTAPVVRGLLDTSVVIALEGLSAEQLPEEPAISALTLAELAAGPLATDDEDEQARRQDRLQRVETLLDPCRSTRRPRAPTAGSMRRPGLRNASPVGHARSIS